MVEKTVVNSVVTRGTPSPVPGELGLPVAVVPRGGAATHRPGEPWRLDVGPASRRPAQRTTTPVVAG